MFNLLIANVTLSLPPNQIKLPFFQNSLQVSWDSALTLSFYLYCHLFLSVILSTLLPLLLLPQFVSIFSLYLQQGSDRLPAPSHCHSDETVSTMSFMWMNPLGWNSQTIKPRKSTTNLTDCGSTTYACNFPKCFYVRALWKLESIMCAGLFLMCACAWCRLMPLQDYLYVEKITGAL